MVKVKNLVWERDEDWRWRGMPPAKIGQFCLNAMQAASGVWYIAGRQARYKTLDEAKAAAQKIFEEIICGQMDSVDLTKEGVNE